MIKGKIIQIVKPEQIKNMTSKQSNMPIWDFENTHYIIVIAKQDFPKNYFMRIFYDIKHRKEEYVWTIAVKDCTKKVGDEIEVNAEPYYRKTNLYIEVEK